MLDLARQSAEGQVSAKEDELCNTKVELMKQQQQVFKNYISNFNHT